MARSEIKMHVSSTSHADDGAAADLLVEAMSPHVQNVKRSSEPGAQDFGAVLTIILGSAVLVEIAKAIGDVIRRDRSCSITVEYPDGHKATFSNVSESTVEAIYSDLKDHLP